MKITRNDIFGGAVLSCAVRYALGRQSYMPSLVIDELVRMLPDCSEKTLWHIHKDVAKWLNETQESSANCWADWDAFRQKIEGEMECRERAKGDSL